MTRQLAPYASTDDSSLGRRYEEKPPNNRTEFQRDRDRIVHSAAFRRLEYKTQVFVNHEGDMFRTRLTHSIEVAQIGRAIASTLSVNEDLTEAIALAHDLGHTPFGHAGQDILNNCMKDYAGFEHNMQSLRIVDELEEKYAEFNGLNLTFESREGIIKHCSIKNAKQLGEVGRRFLDKQQPGIEAQITNIADEIAYNSHDIDDGLRAGLLSIEQLRETSMFNEQYEEVERLYPKLSQRRTIHEIIRRMINQQVTDLLDTSQMLLQKANPTSRQAVVEHGSSLIQFSQPMRDKNLELKQFLRQNLYRHYRVHRMSAKAENIIKSLFTAFLSDSELLPPEAQNNATLFEKDSGDKGRARAIADYIAGMTDRYAILEYEKIFNPKQLT